MRPVQYFTAEYLERCRQMTPDQIIRFVEDFRPLHGGPAGTNKPAKSRLISLRVPEDLLEAFRTKVRLHGRPYQSQIKDLMKQWLAHSQGQARGRARRRRTTQRL